MWYTLFKDLLVVRQSEAILLKTGNCGESLMDVLSELLFAMVNFMPWETTFQESPAGLVRGKHI
jgi:3-deoxy-D-arabino-heptulosonate 7-phosphate (DAHP) synthase class II